jgi:hypothetical protein
VEHFTSRYSTRLGQPCHFLSLALLTAESHTRIGQDFALSLRYGFIALWVRAESMQNEFACMAPRNLDRGCLRTALHAGE